MDPRYERLATIRREQKEWRILRDKMRDGQEPKADWYDVLDILVELAEESMAIVDDLYTSGQIERKD